ncbi:MAG: hypothetical protein ACOY3P_00140 [Planctomycetota bacterium]
MTGRWAVVAVSGVIAWVILLLYDIEFGNTWGAGSYTWIGLSGVALLILTLLASLVGCFCSKFKPVRNVFAVLFLAVLFECVVAMRVSIWQSRISEDRGNAIVQALERFNKDRDGYPENLEYLVPDYLPCVPGTAIGLSQRSFFYRAEGYGDYHLCFTERLGMSNTYDRSRGVWYSTD